MPTVYNAVLVRYFGGHIDIDRSGSGARLELYLEAGGVRDRDAAKAIGTQFLKLSASSFSTVAEQGEVRSIDGVPGASFDMLDHVAGELLQGATFTLTGSGGATVTLERGDARRAKLDGIARTVARAGAGVTKEYGIPKEGTQPQGGPEPSMPPPFSYGGDDLDPRLSMPWPCPKPLMISWLEVTVKPGGAGWADTVVQVLKAPKVIIGSGTTVLGSATLKAGDTKVVLPIGKQLKVGEHLLMALTVDGGIKDLSAKVIGAFV